MSINSKAFAASQSLLPDMEYTTDFLWQKTKVTSDENQKLKTEMVANPDLRVLAIDPSSTATGWALFECTEDYRAPGLLDYGAIKPKRNQDNHKRIEAMALGVDILCEQHRPHLAFIETMGKAPYIRKGPNGQVVQTVANQATLRQAWAVIFAALVANLTFENVYGVSPQRWKGSKSKDYTLDIVNTLYGLELQSKDNDQADAIYIGQWFIKTQGIDPLPPLIRCPL
jgi:Holliday junction resolvasome RuvABC endonuclease subunit